MEAMEDSKQSNNVVMSSEIKQELCALGEYAKYLGIFGFVQLVLVIVILVRLFDSAEDGVKIYLLVMGLGWVRLVMLVVLLILSFVLAVILPFNMLRLNKVLGSNVNELNQDKVEESFVIIKRVFMLTTIAFVVVMVCAIFEWFI